jgi:hypothetical protein
MRRTGRRRNAREKEALATCGYCDTGPCACWSLAATKTTSMMKLGIILTLLSTGHLRSTGPTRLLGDLAAAQCHGDCTSPCLHGSCLHLLSGPHAFAGCP